MDVEHAALVAQHKTLGEYAHEAGQRHQVRAKTIDRLRQRRVERIARGEVAVGDDGGSDAAAGAYSSPAASARLLITAATGKPASTMACRLLPRPEIKMTMLF